MMDARRSALRAARAVLVSFIVVVAASVATAGCDRHWGLFEPPVKLTFVNETDVELCYHPSSADASSGEYCAEVKANGTSVWRPECSLSAEQPMTVVLSPSEGGRELYHKTRPCNEWRESGGKIVITQRGDELIVTDTLPDP